MAKSGSIVHVGYIPSVAQRNGNCAAAGSNPLPDVRRVEHLAIQGQFVKTVGLADASGSMALEPLPIGLKSAQALGFSILRP